MNRMFKILGAYALTNWLVKVAYSAVSISEEKKKQKAEQELNKRELAIRIMYGNGVPRQVIIDAMGDLVDPQRINMICDEIDH